MAAVKVTLATGRAYPRPAAAWLGSMAGDARGNRWREYEPVAVSSVDIVHATGAVIGWAVIREDGTRAWLPASYGLVFLDAGMLGAPAHIKALAPDAMALVARVREALASGASEYTPSLGVHAIGRPAGAVEL